MKKIYNSPELEIVKFAAMEAMADEFESSDGDFIVPESTDEE